MTKYKMVLMTRPIEGREQEYNDWYENVHLKDVTAVHGVKSAQRFRLAQSLPGQDAMPYAAIYDIETDDIKGVFKAIQTGAQSGQISVSEALDRSAIGGAIYEEFGPTVKAE